MCLRVKSPAWLRAQGEKECSVIPISSFAASLCPVQLRPSKLFPVWWAGKLTIKANAWEGFVESHASSYCWCWPKARKTSVFLPSSLGAVVPNIFGTRDPFCGRQFFSGMWWVWVRGWVRVRVRVQAVMWAMGSSYKVEQQMKLHLLAAAPVLCVDQHRSLARGLGTPFLGNHSFLTRFRLWFNHNYIVRDGQF